MIAYLFGDTYEWSQVRGRLAGWTGMWQDRLGLHVDTLPEPAPRWPWLWAWSPGGDAVLRARLDGDTCYSSAACIDPNADFGLASREIEFEPIVRKLEPWPSDHGSVAQYIGTPASLGGMGAPYLSLQMIDLGDGGLTFFVPVQVADLRWTT